MDHTAFAGSTERTVRVIWVRHGETADNARHVIQGHIDTPLNETGIRQSQATRDRLKDVKIDVCFTSDLQRASKTAEIIMEAHPDTPLVIDKRIKEKYLGLMEGQTYYCKRSPEVMASIEPLEAFTDRLLNFWDDLFPPSTPYTNGSASSSSLTGEETHTDPEDSTSSSSTPPKTILPSHPKDLTILICTHGGPVKVAFSALPAFRKHVVWDMQTLKKAKEVKMKVWNCSLSEIVMTKARAAPGQPLSGWVGLINRYADIEHLMIEAAAPKEGTEADAEISNGEGNGPTEAERQEAERRYHIENSHPWWQQGHDSSDDTEASKAEPEQ